MSASFFTTALLPSSLTPASIPLSNRPPQLNFSPVSSHSSMYNDDKQFGYYLKGLIKRYQFKQLQNHQVFNVSGIRFANIMHKIQTCTERGCSCHKKVGGKAQYKDLTALFQTNAPRLQTFGSLGQKTVKHKPYIWTAQQKQVFIAPHPAGSIEITSTFQ